MSTILLVEDAPDLQVTTRLLERHGYAVEVAGDGEQALALLDTHQPDLLLIDVLMPVMDGITLTRKIPRDSRGPIISSLPAT